MYYYAENNSINHFCSLDSKFIDTEKVLFVIKNTVPKSQNYTVCYGHAVNS